MRKRGRHGLALAVAGALLVSISHGGALASPGCNLVNSGAWNTSLQSFSIGVTITSFDKGDVLHFTVSGSGQLALLASSGGSFIAVLFVSPSGSGSFRIVAPYAIFRPLNDAAAGPLNLTATCTPANTGRRSEPADRLSHIAARSFLASRNNALLLADPESTSLMRRRAVAPSPSAAVDAGASFAALPGYTGLTAGIEAAGPGERAGLGASRFDDPAGQSGMRHATFRGRLSEVARASARTHAEMEAERLGLTGGSAAPDFVSPFDVWIEGRYSGFDDDTGGLDRSGHLDVLYLGGDYRLTPDLVVGTLVQLDRMKDTSALLETRAEGNGWMAGPYLSARVLGNVYLDLRAAWGTSSNGLTAGAGSADFDTTRWLVKGEVAGNWRYEAWRLTPTAEIAYVEESNDAFANSAGLVVPGEDVALGRMQFGPEIGYSLLHHGTLIEPFGGLRGVWNFDAPDVATIDGFVVGSGPFWGRLEGGLNVLAADGIAVRGLASWDGVGADDYQGYTLQGTIDVPLN